MKITRIVPSNICQIVSTDDLRVHVVEYAEQTESGSIYYFCKDGICYESVFTCLLNRDPAEIPVIIQRSIIKPRTGAEVAIVPYQEGVEEKHAVIVEGVAGNYAFAGAFDCKADAIKFVEENRLFLSPGFPAAKHIPYKEMQRMVYSDHRKWITDSLFVSAGKIREYPVPNKSRDKEIKKFFERKGIADINDQRVFSHLYSQKIDIDNARFLQAIQKYGYKGLPPREVLQNFREKPLAELEKFMYNRGIERAKAKAMEDRKKAHLAAFDGYVLSFRDIDVRPYDISIRAICTIDSFENRKRYADQHAKELIRAARDILVEKKKMLDPDQFRKAQITVLRTANEIEILFSANNADEWYQKEYDRTEN